MAAAIRVVDQSRRRFALEPRYGQCVGQDVRHRAWLTRPADHFCAGFDDSPPCSLAAAPGVRPFLTHLTANSLNAAEAMGGDPLGDLAKQLLQELSERKIQLEIARQVRIDS